MISKSTKVSTISSGDLCMMAAMAFAASSCLCCSVLSTTLAINPEGVLVVGKPCTAGGSSTSECTIFDNRDRTACSIVFFSFTRGSFAGVAGDLFGDSLRLLMVTRSGVCVTDLCDVGGGDGASTRVVAYFNLYPRKWEVGDGRRRRGFSIASL